MLKLPSAVLIPVLGMVLLLTACVVRPEKVDDSTAAAAYLAGIASQPSFVRLIQESEIQIVGPQTLGTNVLPSDLTIPQITEGNSLFTLNTFTPRYEDSAIIVVCEGILASSGNTRLSIALFKDGGVNAVRTASAASVAVDTPTVVPLRHRFVSGSTSTIQLHARAGAGAAGTVTVNGTGAGIDQGGTYRSYLRVEEWK